MFLQFWQFRTLVWGSHVIPTTIAHLILGFATGLIFVVIEKEAFEYKL